jgi:S1-C subfamily serine protease
LVAGIGGVLVGAALTDDDDEPSVGVSSTTAVTVAKGGLGVRQVAEAVGPSVVTISADVEGDAAVGEAVGTGVIVSADGEILTNAHVVDGAAEIRVRLAGETEPTEAELVASDDGNDLALLKIDQSNLPVAAFAPSGEIQLGDEVIAIGFALDLAGDPTVTLGIVSALDRTIITESRGALDGLIQTDAAISSGNSGGPLVDRRGRIVGINTAVARSNVATAATNVGFAIASDEVQAVLMDLRERSGGEPRLEGFLGISLDERSDGGQGALITQITADSPASEAGLETGDVVISVDDSVTDGAAGVIAAIRDREPGDEVEVVVVRDGKEQTFSVVLTERPED